MFGKRKKHEIPLMSANVTVITVQDRFESLEDRVERLEVVVRTLIKDGEPNGN